MPCLPLISLPVDSPKSLPSLQGPPYSHFSALFPGRDPSFLSSPAWEYLGHSLVPGPLSGMLFPPKSHSSFKSSQILLAPKSCSFGFLWPLVSTHRSAAHWNLVYLLLYSLCFLFNLYLLVPPSQLTHIFRLDYRAPKRHLAPDWLMAAAEFSPLGKQRLCPLLCRRNILFLLCEMAVTHHSWFLLSTLLLS